MAEEEDAKKVLSPSKRKKKQVDDVSIADSETTESTLVASTEDEETETDTVATSVDDGLPHPRVYPPLLLLSLSCTILC